MKTRFNTFDIICSIAELQKLVGMRVNNIYDIDNKTYLIKFQKTEEKSVLLLESGNRFHTTSYEWPKNVAPSGFSMKLRKHLKNKRLESFVQLGSDRIVKLQFGSGEAAYHVILELYDRGNIILADYELMILNILRPHTEGEDVKFMVKEKYPEDRARDSTLPLQEKVLDIFKSAKNGDGLKKILMPHLEYGPSLIEHVLIKNGFKNNAKLGKDFDINTDFARIYSALEEAEKMFNNATKEPCKGYITQKKEERPNPNQLETKEYFFSNQEFHPCLFAQHEEQPYQVFETFNQAVDEFFSTLQGQKIDLKVLQQEREAVKKLENVRKDHNQRLSALEKVQEFDKIKAELITKNQELVDNAILSIQSALVSQVSWDEINELIKEATKKGDPIAKQIKQLKLESNHISLLLSDPYIEEEEKKYEVIDIDLGLSAFANARRYYDQKRSAAKKQQKTVESQGKALKSAEKKTKQVLKEMQTTTNINKARKVYWFEKFFWFISSENFLVIGGRDQQQNELIVKRYMKPKDIYVHADIHGASSIIIKNPKGTPVPPKTLNEAGTMAICYSVAWDAKVLTNAYWVFGEQVSKSAPTGEYLTVGSFMIRGKKNFLPPSYLILGLGFLFRLEDGSLERHMNERKVVAGTDESIDGDFKEDDVEIIISDNSEDEDKVDDNGDSNLSVIKEEGKGLNEEIDQHLEHESDGNEDNKGESKSDESQKDESVQKQNLNEEQEDLEGTQFPDTHIKIKHSGERIDILTESTKQFSKDEDKTNQKKNRSRNPSENSIKSKGSSKLDVNEESKKQMQNQVKRGQKSRLKKIKEKYKDQDDEERELRMKILQTATRMTKKREKNKEKEKIEERKIAKATRPKPERFEIDDEVVIQADVDMIDCLTGIPLTEDELLFAVPVIAPYNTLAQYKFKVKITPGTSRRGKAAKTAVNMFLQDKSITQREKDLLKAVKDDSLARNLPGKVKLSAPRLQALRK